MALRLGFRFRVYLLHLVRFYQAYCTPIMHYSFTVTLPVAVE